MTEQQQAEAVEQALGGQLCKCCERITMPAHWFVFPICDACRRNSYGKTSCNFYRCGYNPERKPWELPIL